MANDFINDVADKAKNAAEYAGKKVGVVVDITKLNVRLMESKNALEKSYNEIGKLTYAARKDGTDNEAAISDACLAADRLIARIDSLKAELASAKGLFVCPNCGKSNPDGSAFCNYCGANLKDGGAK